jgi:hypothetical protein
LTKALTIRCVTAALSQQIGYRTTDQRLVGQIIEAKLFQCVVPQSGDRLQIERRQLPSQSAQEVRIVSGRQHSDCPFDAALAISPSGGTIEDDIVGSGCWHVC